MLRLLLDAHLSPVVAREVRRHRHDCEIVALRDWENGAYLHEPDDQVILDRARVLGFTLVTRDVRTVYPLLEAWAVAGHLHAGVVFVDGRTIAERDTGGLVGALIDLWDGDRERDWEGHVVYLRRSM